MRSESTIAEAFSLTGLVLGLSVVASSVATRLDPLVWIAAYQVLIVTTPVVLFAVVRRQRFRFGFGHPAAADVLVAMAVGVGLALTNIGVVIPLSPLTPSTQSTISDALAEPSLPLALLVLALLPAIGEELLFRGVLLRALAPRGKVLALVLSAVVFACFHFSLAQLPPLFLVGIATGIAALTSGVVAAIVIHIANNATAIALFHLAPIEIGVGAGVGGAAIMTVGSGVLVLRGRSR